MIYLPGAGAVEARWFGFGGGEVTFGAAETTFEGAETTFGEEDTEFDGGETGADAALLAGTTGDVCFTGPPTTIGLFLGPPTELCARAGLAKAQRMMADINAPLFIRDSFQVMLATDDRRRTSPKIRFVSTASTANPIHFPYRFIVSL